VPSHLRASRHDCSEQSGLEASAQLQESALEYHNDIRQEADAFTH
jgi:hypothetical protein